MTQLTPQSTDPQTRIPVAKPRERNGRRRAIVIGAVAVVALLVGAVLFVTLPSPGDAAGREGVHSEQSLATPDAVVAEAQSVLPSYAAGSDPVAVAEEAAAQAQAELDTAAETAQSVAVHEATTQANGLAAEVAGSAPALPTAPSGWAPGVDVSRFAGTVGSAPYPLPSFGAPVGVGDVSDVDPVELGGSFATGHGAPDTGVAEVDAMTQQVGVLDGTYDQLSGQDLDAVLGGLGQGGLPALPTDEATGGLTGGLVPTPGADDGAIDPDDEGAMNALAFGYELTDDVTGAFGTMDADAQSVLAGHAALPGTVDALAAETRTVQATGAADIQGELESRIANADSVREATVARLTAGHDAHVAAVQAEAVDAQAEVDAAVADARSELESEGDAQVLALEDAAANVEADAEKRKNDVQAKADEYVALLEGMAADGTASPEEAAAAAAQVRTEAERVQASIDSDAQTQASAFEEAAADLRAEADAKLAEFDATAAGLPDAQSEADALVAQADRDLAFHSAVADAHRDLSIDAHRGAADAARAQLEADADARVEEIRAAALEYLDASDAYAETGKGLVAQVQTDGDAHAQTAVDYVLSVAEDYESVPEPERVEAAEALRGEAATLTTIADGVLASGAQVDGSFDAIVSAGEDVRAQVEGMVL